MVVAALEGTHPFDLLLTLRRLLFYRREGPFPQTPFPTLPYQPSHIPPRQAASASFFRLFLVSNFSFQNPSQSLSKGPAWDPKITKKPKFFVPKPSQGPSFCPFLGRFVFLSLFVEFLVIFSGKHNTKNDATFHSCAFFLELPTSTIVWFLQCESYFFSFGLFEVFQ